MKRTKGKLKEMAALRGMSLEELIVEAVGREGSIYAAANSLGVSPNTIQYHKNKLGLDTTRKTALVVEQAS